MKIGDRFRYISGEIWTIKNIFPTFILMNDGEEDINVSFDFFCSYEGDPPYAVRRFTQIN